MRRHLTATAIGWLVLALTASAQSPAGGGEKGEYNVSLRMAEQMNRECGNDWVAVGLESANAARRSQTAWLKRDAGLFLQGTDPSFTLKRPNGAVMTFADLKADIERRMAMTKSIDYMRSRVEVISVEGNHATVLSHQDWSRVLVLGEGQERRRITTVTHREQWEKTAQGWKMLDFKEENQTARWEDEPAKNP